MKQHLLKRLGMGVLLAAWTGTAGAAYTETMEGFTCNADKSILTPADARSGKWGHEPRKWKASWGKPE